MAKATIPAAKKLSGGQCKNKSGHKQTQSPDRALKKKNQELSNTRPKFSRRGQAREDQPPQAAILKASRREGVQSRNPFLRHIQYDKTKPVEK